MGGNILKTAFTGIVGTLCVVLFLLTAMVVFHNFPVETYKGILEVLGIPTLFGMIVQSFIHQKPEDVPNDQNTKVVSTSTTVIKSPIDGKSGQPIVNPGSDTAPSN